MKLINEILETIWVFFMNGFMLTMAILFIIEGYKEYNPPETPYKIIAGAFLVACIISINKINSNKHEETNIQP